MKKILLFICLFNFSCYSYYGLDNLHTYEELPICFANGGSAGARGIVQCHTAGSAGNVINYPCCQSVVPGLPETGIF